MFQPTVASRIDQSRSRSDQGEVVEARSARSFYGSTHIQRESSPIYARSFYGHAHRESSPDNHTRSAASTLGDPQISPNHHTWEPGLLGLCTCPQPNPAQPNVCSLIAEMQRFISAEIQKVQVAVETLGGRVSKLEKDYIDGTEHHLGHTPMSSASHSSTDSSVERSRKRCIPTVLSVSITSYVLYC